MVKKVFILEKMNMAATKSTPRKIVDYKNKWSDNPGAQMDFMGEYRAPIIKNLEREVLLLKESNKKLKKEIEKLRNVSKREADRWRQRKKARERSDLKQFEKQCNGLGFCLICNCLDLDILEEHHIFGVNMNDITVTLCPNCHNRLHRFMGVPVGRTSR